MKTIADLKTMQREPASKEWFEKHGLPGSVKNHPMKPKNIALDRKKVSKEEVVARFKEKQIAKHGGVEKYQKHLQDTRNSISKALSSHKEPSDKEKSEHQSRIGRAYND